MSRNHSYSHVAESKNKLLIVFGITALYLVAEVIGGFLTHSLALWADAGHMLTDLVGSGLALFAIWFAQRPANQRNTYGFYRAEILAAVINAVVLFIISFFILYEAWRRFENPPVVMSWPMLVVAVIGLFVNFIGMKLLHAHSKNSLNVKGAYLEAMSDMISSLGVIIASLVMLKTGWYLADPIISAGIGLFILPRTWSLLGQSLHILMEGAPAHIDMESVEETMLKVRDVKAIHDLHVWTITSGVESMSAHVTVSDPAQGDRILGELQKVLEDKFKIEHTTIQIEIERCEGKDASEKCFK